MKTSFVNNGIRYSFIHPLSLREVEERAAAIMADPNLWTSAREKATHKRLNAKSKKPKGK